ncbi:MAG: ABC transporter permease [Burkholderiales bacterium]|jgi:ABC-2 type transport system permease protein|nr:ABC transporter permease [Burkholderiales bacterium]
MSQLFTIAKLDFFESFRSRWFIGYAAVFLLLVVAIFLSGVTESRVMGFSGLTRLLLIFIQACNIILPIFILVTTVRTIAKERDSNVFEYLLSFPVPLATYYWGKVLGRLLVIWLPLLLALLLALGIGLAQGSEIPWRLLVLYTALLACSSLTFLGIGFFISVSTKSQELALGMALFIWLLLIALIDIALIGFLIQQMVPDNLIFALALFNPVQTFRIAAIALFDPVLSVIGPTSYFLLDTFGSTGIIAYALSYLCFIGFLFLSLGYLVFRRRDLL